MYFAPKMERVVLEVESPIAVSVHIPTGSGGGAEHFEGN